MCALVGIGGAGKTAIAERFLHVLPAVMPTQADLPKDDTLPTPDGLFVFSFYDAPNPDAFFAHLTAWLKREPYDESARQPSFYQTLGLLEQAGSCLLVLDGLEKVQDDSLRGGAFGRITDGRLRDFVLRTADGLLPNVAVLITTRFRLFDTLLQRCPYYKPIAIEKLAPGTAIALLRAKGVEKGTDSQLEAIARDQGLHALTVDLIGGYIARFCDGDPARLPPDPAVRAREEQYNTLDPEAAAIREQERRLARVAERYGQALIASDRAALALLQRVCLFRLGTDAQTLASIFTGTGKEGISGPQLAALSLDGVWARLALLAEMGLLEVAKREMDGASRESAIRNSKPEIITVHPAIRDGLFHNLDPDAIRKGHEATREFMKRGLFLMEQSSVLWLPPRLSRRPGKELPSDLATLDKLEEIIYHTFKAGHPQEAFDLYWWEIGEFKNLGDRLGMYERGERICRIFTNGRPLESAQFSEDLPEYARYALLDDSALYLKGLGQLDASNQCFERLIELRRDRKDSRNATIVQTNLAQGYLLAGRLAAAIRVSEECLTLAERDGKAQQNSYAWIASACGLRGEVKRALASFHTSLKLQQKIDGNDNPLYASRGIDHTDLLSRLGRITEASRLAKRNKAICLNGWTADSPWTHRCNLMLAELVCKQGDINKARKFLQQTYDWALAHDAKELLCWSARIRGQIAVAEARWIIRLHRREIAHLLHEARASIEEGLRIARECGFGIHHIDLLLLRVQVHLMQADPEAAERDARTALFGLSTVEEGTSLYDAPAFDESAPPARRGIFPPSGSGLSQLLAATHPECGYAWGEAKARHQLVEALLLRAAQTLGRTHVDPARRAELPRDALTLVEAAEKELILCLELRKRIQDPKQAETQRVLVDLGRGVLTKYLLSHRMRDAGYSSTSPKTMAEGKVERVTSPFINQTHEEIGSVMAADSNELLHPTIGIITALPKEYTAVKAMLANGRPCRVVGQGAGREYWLGDIPSTRGGRHLVVLSLADMGNSIAATRATLMLEHFPTLESIIMTGIAGGVPHPKKADDHVRLGDVVISNKNGVIQYDFDKETDKAIEIRSAPVPPSARLLEAVRLLEAGELEGRRPWLEFIKPALKQLKWQRPSKKTDVLVSTEDPSKVIEHPKDSKRRGVQPRIFLGPIASANKLLKNPIKRDTLRDQFSVKAVEMEGSGIADATWNHERGYLVVRGICDYCDSTKGDAWQAYAAVIAAGYTRALIEFMPAQFFPVSANPATLPSRIEALKTNP